MPGQAKAGKSRQALRYSATVAVGKGPKREDFASDAEFQEKHERWIDDLQVHRCNQIIADPTYSFDRVTAAKYEKDRIEKKWAERDVAKAAPGVRARKHELPDTETLAAFYRSLGVPEDEIEARVADNIDRGSTLATQGGR